MAGSLSWQIKVRERFMIEPSFSAFNLFNFANFDTRANRLSGVLNNVVGTAVNATTSASHNTRTGVGSGVFALGAPRQMEFGLRLTF